MSRNSYWVRSHRTLGRDLGIAAVLLAAAGVTPAVATAGDDVTSPAAELRDAPEQQALAIDKTMTEGNEVRASYQETSRASKALPIETQRGTGQAVRSDEGQTVRTMSPDDPEWDQVHQAGG